jgi:hypothetical protein
MNSHSIVLSSAYSLGEYPENNGCEFTNELRLPLDFRGPNEKWLMTISEMVYESDYWQNIRKVFSTVRITLSKFRTHYVQTAWIGMRLLYVKPQAGFFTQTKGLIPIDIRCVKLEYMGGVIEQYAYTVKTYDCVGHKMGSNDVYGEPINWGQPTAEGWYKYTTIYGLLLIEWDVFEKIWHMVTSMTKNVRFRLAESLEDVKYTIPQIDAPIAPQWLVDRVGWSQATIQYAWWLGNNLSIEEDFQFAYPSPATTAIHRPVWTAIEMPEQFYASNEEFIALFNKLVNEKINSLLFKSYATITYFFKTPNPYVLFELKDKKLQYHSPGVRNITLTLKFHPTMAYIMGLTSISTSDLGEVAIKPELAKANLEMDMTRGRLTSLWVYCDIAQPSFIKDSSRPLLRCLPIDRTSNQVSYEASTLQYKFLNSNYIQRIKIWLSEDHRAIPLKANGGVTYIRLEFQKQV